MPDESLYITIAERYGFELPSEYRTLRDKGFMTLDRPAKDISSTPGDGYLWLNDMEWLSLEEIAKFELPEFYRPHLPHLVPFAFTGGGDYWCWQTDHLSNGTARVLLCPHDCQEATVYAPSFPAALYRQALAYASSVGGSTSLEEGRAYLHRWAVDLASIMPSAWCQTLESLTQREPAEAFELHIKVTTIFPYDERLAVESRDLNFADLNEEIPWSNLEEA